MVDPPERSRRAASSPRRVYRQRKGDEITRRTLPLKHFLTGSPTLVGHCAQNQARPIDFSSFALFAGFLVLITFFRSIRSFSGSKPM